jgi:hypothetical protein
MKAKLVEKFQRGQDPIKSMGLGYGSKRETIAWKVLEFIKSKGEEGASFTEIQKLAWMLGHPDRSEEDFYEKNEPTKWYPNAQRKTRGYWTTNFGAYSGRERRGLLDYYCKKNDKGKWVIARWPKPGENLIAEAVNFERGLDPKKAMDIGLYWKKDLEDLIAGLKKIGIKAKYKTSFTYGKGVYDFTLENLFDEEDEENINGYQLSYVTKKAAAEYLQDEEGWEPGFAVASEDGESLLDPTMSVNQVIRFFAKRLFGMSLKARIIGKQEELKKLMEIQEYLDSITPAHMR